jgi:hypothetical protein
MPSPQSDNTPATPFDFTKPIDLLGTTSNASVSAPTPTNSHVGPVLANNLALLARRSPRAAAAILTAAPRFDAAFQPIPNTPHLSAIIGTGTNARQLCSRRDPIREAQSWADGVDIARNAVCVVRGFGLGHHIHQLALRIGPNGAILCFEPDVPLLRAVLERVDITPLLRTTDFGLICEANDTAALAHAATGIEGVLAAGTGLVDHPQSIARLDAEYPGACDRFAQTLTDVTKAVRTNVVTTLVQMHVSVRNQLNNLGPYAACDGIADLKNAATGSPAIIVAAGPSLARNLDVLEYAVKNENLRDRVVIVAVQTVLKQLLARGIKPHFVTALDYHEISARFYEGLTARDVEGVTLVAEPKCNPAILRAFPGTIRLVDDATLNSVLGDPKGTKQPNEPTPLARPMGEIPAGATVAHMAYYLARYLGCDPVILIGQDLGFTNDLYYGPNAAIHQVWSGELSPFRTLETLEWERIVRMRTNLRKIKDQSGRRMFTDEQMATYLVQFEREFVADAARNLRTIDATEGGAAKQGTTTATLRDALAQHATTAKRLSLPLSTQARALPTVRDAVIARLHWLNESATRVATYSDEAIALLNEMEQHQANQPLVNRHITTCEALSRKATTEPAFWMVNLINQTGQLKRYKSNRLLGISKTLTPMERQKGEIQRDRTNVSWLRDSAQQASKLLTQAIDSLTTGRVITNEETQAETNSAILDGETTAGSRRRVVAAIIVDHQRSALGTPRDLSQTIADGRNALWLTLNRLDRARSLDGVVLLATNTNATLALLQLPPGSDAATFTLSGGLRISIEQLSESEVQSLRHHQRVVRAARAFCPTAWRGGIRGMSAYDEALCSEVVASVAERSPLFKGVDAVVACGADWPLVQPQVVDETVARYRDDPERRKLTFAHAPVGLGVAVVDMELLRELATQSSNGTPLANIGALLGYVPIAPQLDPITKPACVTVLPALRDALARCTADGLGLSPRVVRTLSACTTEAALAQALKSQSTQHPAEVFGIQHFSIAAAALMGDEPTSNVMTMVAECADRPWTISIEATHLWSTGEGFGRVSEAVTVARELGAIAVNVSAGSADLEGRFADAVRVLAADVFSVVLFEPIDDVRPSDGLINELHEWSTDPESRNCSLIVPRMQRAESTLDAIEGYVDRFLLAYGTAVIDPPSAGEDGRLVALPLPENVLAMRAATTVQLTPGATVLVGHEPLGSLCVEEIGPITRALRDRWEPAEMPPVTVENKAFACATTHASVAFEGAI